MPFPKLGNLGKTPLQSWGSMEPQSQGVPGGRETEIHVYTPECTYIRMPMQCAVAPCHEGPHAKPPRLPSGSTGGSAGGVSGWKDEKALEHGHHCESTGRAKTQAAKLKQRCHFESIESRKQPTTIKIGQNRVSYFRTVHDVILPILKGVLCKSVMYCYPPVQ